MNNMKVIDTFLANWKAEAKKFHTKGFETYLEQMAFNRQVRDAYAEIPHPPWMERSGPRFELKEEIKRSEKFYQSTLTASAYDMYENMKYEKHCDRDPILVLDKNLDREVKAKKINLIARIEKKAGVIFDASYLKIGVDGNLNGIVEGDIDKVTVTTIYAGGYNIQCLHYRVLVKVLK